MGDVRQAKRAQTQLAQSVDDWLRAREGYAAWLHASSGERACTPKSQRVELPFSSFRRLEFQQEKATSSKRTRSRSIPTDDMASYDDEIDLYGDAEVQQPPAGASGSHNDRIGHSTSSIPTFISEARGGTGKIPVRDEYQNSPDPQNQTARAGSNGRSESQSLEGIMPKGGDYGAPGQWSTKPVSTVRPSDMPEEGQVFLSVSSASGIPHTLFLLGTPQTQPFQPFAAA